VQTVLEIPQNLTKFFKAARLIITMKKLFTKREIKWSTLEISHDLHTRIKLLAVAKRERMQDVANAVITLGLKAYAKNMEEQMKKTLEKP
jgi:hypothetical protein